MTVWDVDSYLVSVVGMPRKVAEAVAVMEELWPYDDGPAHVVIADWNLSDGILRACIDSIDNGETLSIELEGRPDHPVYVATRAVLQWLLDNTTEAERDDWERYPPPWASGSERAPEGR